MYSVGIDMVEIARIKKSMKNPRFLNFILGEEEYDQLKNKNFISQSVAANFCAKEAFAKAVGTGFKGLDIKEVQILRNELLEIKPELYNKKHALNKINNNYWRNKAVNLSMA